MDLHVLRDPIEVPEKAHIGTVLRGGGRGEILLPVGIGGEFKPLQLPAAGQGILCLANLFGFPNIPVDKP